MIDELLTRAAQIEVEYGPDIEEALIRWQDAGAWKGGREARPWLSVAFLFSRRARARRRSFR